MKKKITAEHLIRDFLDLQRELGRRPKFHEFRKRHHSNKVLLRVFGGRGWGAMLKALGDRVLASPHLTLDHLLDDYLEMERELFRRPRQEEFRKRHHSINVLVRIFGKNPWSNLARVAEERKKSQVLNRHV